MKLIATGLLAAAMYCAADVSFAQCLEGTARHQPLAGVASVPAPRPAGTTALRKKTDSYASVDADDAVPGPWIDDTSVRDLRHRLR